MSRRDKRDAATRYPVRKHAPLQQQITLSLQQTITLRW